MRIGFEPAIASQPDALSVALVAIRRSLGQARLEPWADGDAVAVIGMGASHHSGHALCAAVTASGRRAHNLVASDVAGGVPDAAAAPIAWARRYVVVTESGRSPEPLGAARALPRVPGDVVIGVTNDADSPLADVVEHTIDLGGIDDSPVYTAGYVATLMAYAELLDAVGVAPGGAERIPGLVGDALERYAGIADRVGEVVADASAVDAVGRGGSYAAASETALMVREALRTPAAGYETFQYLHGPMESAGPRTVLIVFGDGRETTLATSVLEAGVRVVLVTAASVDVEHAGLTVIPVADGLTVFERAAVETVIGQLIVRAAARRKPFLVEDFLYHQDDTKLPGAQV